MKEKIIFFLLVLLTIVENRISPVDPVLGNLIFIKT